MTMSREYGRGEAMAKARKLTRPGRGAKMAASLIKGRTVGRQREKEPDRKTPEGQLSLYLAHLLRAKGKTPADLAEKIGVQRSTVFNWLRGDSTPPVKLWAGIAKELGLKDWRSILPPQKFIDTL